MNFQKEKVIDVRKHEQLLIEYQFVKFQKMLGLQPKLPRKHPGL